MINGIEKNIFNNEEYETRLWENDSSYLIAVSPHVYENDRIRLKLILGYRIQSQVHGLPNPYENQSRRLLLPDRYNRYRNSYMDNIDNISIEEFDKMSETQQRRVLREKYLRKKYEDTINIQNNTLPNNSMNQIDSFGTWAFNNFDRLGWKSLFGLLGVVFGFYNTLR
jgi:hypothetical protein